MTPSNIICAMALFPLFGCLMFLAQARFCKPMRDEAPRK